MKKYIFQHFTIALLAASFCMGEAQAQRKLTSNTPTNSHKESNEDDNDEEDPCIVPDDMRFCWTLNPITGDVNPSVPDTSFVNHYQTDVMESKALAINYLGNLWSPHQVDYFLKRPLSGDFMFADVYSLFARKPEQILYYNTRIPFTSASYSKSGSGLTENDHFKLDFAGNIRRNIGLGTSLDYVYARGEYQSQGTKPLKWISYAYYQGERYQVYASTNLSYYGNQENGGIADRNYVLRPEQVNSNFTDPVNMPTNLIETWNATNHFNAHLTQRYHLGFYRTEEGIDSTDVEEIFVPVTTLFHSIDFNHYKRRFTMDKGADVSLGGDFFKNWYNDSIATADSMSYRSFSTQAGIRLNEGFNKYSQFGMAAFIGYELQSFTNMVDSTNLNFIDHKHTSHNIWLGGNICRFQGSAFNFDAWAETCITGDKVGDVKMYGFIRTKIPVKKNDSILVKANASFQNRRVSYYMDHLFSNHFKWDNDFNREQRLRIDGEFAYTRSRTSLVAGIENINNFHYFDADCMPQQYGQQLSVFSLELRQPLKAGIFHWDNSILVQTSTNKDILPLPLFSIQSDFSLHFAIAKVLRTQLGVCAYYHTKYYAQNYQPATQVFYTQNQYECGGYPVVNPYINCHLKRIRFYFMMYNVLDKTFSNDNFISPYYPLQPRRMEMGLSISFQN